MRGSEGIRGLGKMRDGGGGTVLGGAVVGMLGLWC